MKSECIEAVAKAIGRNLTQQEVQGIEDRLSRHMRQNAVKDPQAALSMSHDQRLAEAAKAASDELVAEAAKRKQRVALSILAHDRVERQLGQFKNGFDGLERLIAFHADAKGNVLSVESRAAAIRNDALRQMLDTMEATNPKFFGLFENQAGVRDLIREIHGEDTGNAVAKKGAKAWGDVTEALRTRFNRSGGDVGKLDDWGMPHHHAQARVAKAGRQQWIADVMPMLERRRYTNEDGSVMTDAQVAEWLGHAWETIATGGANKIEPGQFRGNGMRANRGNQSRQVHFKSGDAYLDYQRKYGERALYDSLVGHIEGSAKNIAMVEAFGPNPDNTFGYFRDKAEQAMSMAQPTKIGHARRRATSVDSLYNYVAGKQLPVASEALAKSFDALRNWLSASRLGSAVITSLSDEATLYLTGKVNNLPAMRLMANELATLNPANRMEKRLALRAGLAMNTYIASLNRYGNEMLGHSFSRKLATTTLRASGLLAITEARKRAFGVTYMHALGAVVHDHAALGDLDPVDHRILLSKGITDTDYAVWRRATPEDWGGGNDTMLTPDAIYRIPDADLADLGNPRRLKEEAATRLLGVVLEETDMAVIEPGASERAKMMSGVQRGTWKGELARSLFLFKSFPIAMINRHLRRGWWGMPAGTGRAAYLATLFAGTTVAGMASLQANELLNGRDPRNIKDPRVWMAALLKGGALSIYGDLLFSDSTRYGSSALSTVQGPVASEVEDILKLTQGYAVAKANHERTNEGANLVRFAQGNIPLINQWYTKAAFNHLFFYRLSEHFSPGYLNRMRRRAQKEYQQRYWWEPGEHLPQRAPDLSSLTKSNR